MEITPYGICFGIGVFVTSCIIGSYSWTLIVLFIAGMIMQGLLCNSCWDQFTLASVLGALPLLFVLFLPDCEYLKRVLFGMAVGSVIGRIGCYFVGCCSGAETSTDNKLGLTYRDAFINRKFGKDEVCVKPTILVEIVLQALIALAVWKSDYGIVLYGVLNLVLLFLTNLWRCEPRMGSQTWVTYASLALFSIIGAYRCGAVGGVGKGAFVFRWSFLFWALVVMLQTSNDFTVGAMERFVKKHVLRS